MCQINKYFELVYEATIQGYPIMIYVTDLDS